MNGQIGLALIFIISACGCAPSGKSAIPSDAGASDMGENKPVPIEFAHAFGRQLNAIKAGWEVKNGELRGPDGEKVRFSSRDCADEEEGHVDVEFIPGPKTKNSRVLWDCVAGVGDSTEGKAEMAAAIWGQTTAPAILEYGDSAKGKLADHYHGDDAAGFDGWYVIAGAVLGYGLEDSGDRLQKWWLTNPILPKLVASLSPTLSSKATPHGVKVLFGGRDIAEVKVDGVLHKEATEALQALPWPRLDPPGFVRSYFIFVRPDTMRTTLVDPK